MQVQANNSIAEGWVLGAEKWRDREISVCCFVSVGGYNKCDTF